MGGLAVVGVLLTGLGVVTAGLLTENGAARVLAAVTVVTAAAAVACALAAQVLTITRHLNPADLSQVQAWYRRPFRTRAYPTLAAVQAGKAYLQTRCPGARTPGAHGVTSESRMDDLREVAGFGASWLPAHAVRSASLAARGPTLTARRGAPVLSSRPEETRAQCRRCASTGHRIGTGTPRSTR